MKVLIVDDERDIRETLDMVLRYAGYETRLASGASEALAELGKDPLPGVQVDQCRRQDEGDKHGSGPEDRRRAEHREQGDSGRHEGECREVGRPDRRRADGHDEPGRHRRRGRGVAPSDVSDGAANGGHVRWSAPGSR